MVRTLSDFLGRIVDAESNQQPMRRRDIRRAEQRAARRAKLSFLRRDHSADSSSQPVAPKRAAESVPAVSVRGSDGSKLRAYRLRRRLAGSSIAAVAAAGVIGGGFAFINSSVGESSSVKAAALTDSEAGPQAESVGDSGAQSGDSTSGKNSSISGGVLSSEGSKAHAASRVIEKTALPGCDGKAPKGEVGNGELPSDWLCDIGKGGHKLRADAAVAFAQMNAAYKADTGKDLELTDTYRPIESQRAVASKKPGLAAAPGTSLHGWGIAIDFGGGTASGDGQQYNWLVEHGGEYGWENPDWAKGSKQHEPWHWEYVPARKMIKGH